MMVMMAFGLVQESAVCLFDFAGSCLLASRCVRMAFAYDCFASCDTSFCKVL